MAFIVVALVAGVVLGLVRGGSIANLGRVAFRWWPVLLAGIAVQAVSAFTGEPLAVPLLLASYALLSAFALANVRWAGMGLIFVGIALNASTIAVNGGMPVEDRAIVAAGIADWEEIDDLQFGAKHHLAGPEDRLLVISDVIPVPPLREVLSFGDLVMSVGVAVVLVHLLRRPRRASDQAPAPSVWAAR